MQNDNRQHANCSRGFTLVELILVVGTIGLVTGALVGVVGNSYKDFKAGSDRSTALQDGQAAIDQITRILRQAKSISKITSKWTKTGHIEFQDADGITKRIERNSTTNELKYGKPGRLSTLFGNATHLYITGYTKSGSTTNTESDIRALQFDLTLKDASSPFTGKVYLPIDHPIIEPDIPQIASPVALWTLDNIGVRNHVMDWSAYGNHGVLDGPWYVNGKFGKALAFDGTNDKVRYYLPRAKTLNYTVALWAKTNNTGQQAFRGLFHNNNDAKDSFQIDVSGGSASNYRYNVKSRYAAIFGRVSTGWKHLALTGNGTRTRLYFNGNQVATNTNMPARVFDRYVVGTNRGGDM